ncbi:VRR-NUC domain-containing protein [Thiothrix sp.]|jgi:hypothetical protein|uniref:VRR-NUC domain-containing protein n=1 Tax=Thiothrix sp. TaxID=1032 RepID=UPI00257E748B|nr:VRR-NUC domain-containing protein [Thiothrix sp.]
MRLTAQQAKHLLGSRQGSLLQAMPRHEQQFYSHMVQASEHDIQKAILDYLARCSRVAFAHRQNTGQTKYEDGHGETRYVRYGWVGCSDIIGMLTDGRFLAIEVKSRTGRLSEEQAAFLDCVNAGGGVGIVARSVDDVIKGLTR